MNHFKTIFELKIEMMHCTRDFGISDCISLKTLLLFKNFVSENFFIYKKMFKQTLFNRDYRSVFNGRYFMILEI